jgi:hypothetical protein
MLKLLGFGRERLVIAPEDMKAVLQYQDRIRRTDPQGLGFTNSQCSAARRLILKADAEDGPQRFVSDGKRIVKK